ncbi:MAG: helix-turn-helix domain containing protein [bacterium]|nr:helix-turn-helix domain containing protein [bacterium]
MKKAKIKQSPKLPAETRREQLLLAAARLFEVRGFDATSTNEIALAAGLTKGALYYHFKNKEAILIELLERMIRGHLEGLNASMKPGLTPVDLLRILNDNDCCKEGTLSLRHDLDFRAQVARVPGIQKIVNQAVTRGCNMAAEHMGKEYGKTRQRRAKVALMIFCLWDGLKIRSAQSSRSLNMKEMIDVADILLTTPQNKR